MEAYATRRTIPMKTIVFSDVDGTLLTDDKRVRPATRAAVRTLA